jgi:hypothetical protein
MSRIANFVITIQPIPQEALLVNFGTRSGTAISGVDFTPASGVTSFAPGEQTKTIPVLISDNAELGKRFFMDVSWIDATGKTVIRPTGTCIIDTPTVLVEP